MKSREAWVEPMSFLLVVEDLSSFTSNLPVVSSLFMQLVLYVRNLKFVIGHARLQKESLKGRVNAPSPLFSISCL